MSNSSQNEREVTPRPRRDQFVGALLGCAVADALGAPLEGRTREDIATFTDLTAHYRPFREYAAGQYTDDTQLTVALARSLIATGNMDGAVMAKELVALWESGEIVGAGPVAHRAVKRLMDGVDWREAALADDLPLNGAAMRVSPVGLWHYDRSENLAADVEASSIVTHRHPLAIDAAIATACAVACASTFESIHPEVFLGAVAGSIESRNPEFAAQIGTLGNWLALDDTAALESIVAATGQPSMKNGFGILVLAVPTVLAALWAFLKSPDDYVAMLERALRVGGDVDTVAAIAGAICGARNGAEAMPIHLIRGLKDADEIRALGEQLFDRRFER